LLDNSGCCSIVFVGSIAKLTKKKVIINLSKKFPYHLVFYNSD
jgi:hypothetical protein